MEWFPLSGSRAKLLGERQRLFRLSLLALIVLCLKQGATDRPNRFVFTNLSELSHAREVLAAIGDILGTIRPCGHEHLGLECGRDLRNDHAARLDLSNNSPLLIESLAK